jgi:hypothetical protein
MPFFTFQTYLHHLLELGVIVGRCAVFFKNIPTTDGFCGDIITFGDPSYYPDVFTRVPIDIEGAEIRMSGMFGQMTCVFEKGTWSTLSYHTRMPLDSGDT